MQHYPFVIVGQGISGSVLSLQLKNKGIEHLVIDAPSLSLCSKVAAGVVNPIVLKRLKKVHLADVYLNKAHSFYSALQPEIKEQFFHPNPILHLLHNQEEQNLWLEKSEHPSFSTYLGEVVKNNLSHHLNAPFGLGVVKQTFWVNTALFCSAVGAKIPLITHQLNADEINVTENVLNLNGTTIHYDYLIDASGHLSYQLFPATSSAFSPTRGEVLVVKLQDVPPDYVYHAGVFIVPLGDNLFKVGASYHWDDLQDLPTETGKLWLQTELEKMYKGAYTVVEHQAGVRPNTKDRKPLIGQLNKQLYCFNGMGSRAVLMAPYLASLLINHLTKQKDIPAEFLPKRFLSE